MQSSLEKADPNPSWVDDFQFGEGAIAEPSRGRRWRRWLAILIVVAALIAAAIWFLNPFGTTAASTFVTGKATTGTIVASVNISGSVASSSINELNFGSAGTVTKVNVVPGDTVTAGEVLATIDDTALQVQIQSAEANLAAAQAKLDLDTAGPTSQTIASAKDQVASAQFQLTTAKQSLADTKAQNSQNTSQANAAVTAAQAQLDADTATLAPGDPQLAKDQADLANAKTNLSSVQLKATQSLHQAENQVTSATLGLTSAQHAYDLKVVPATAAQLASDNAAVAQAQQSLTTLQATGAAITSPIDGTVTVVNVKVGQSVTAQASQINASSVSTTGLIEVMDLTKLQIAGQTSETDVPKLKLDQSATISATSLGSDTVIGKVCQLSIVGTQISGVTSFGVTVCLDASNPALLVGMSATAAVVTERADGAVLVPSLAVKTVGGQRVVTVLGEDGKTQTNVQVTVGISNGSETQILTGLTGTETVVESVQTTTPGNGFPGGGGGTRIFGGGGFGGG